MARTCSGWPRTRFLRSATGSAPAAIARSSRASGMPRTCPWTPRTVTDTGCRSTPTRNEARSTKPSCQQSYTDTWATTFAPQPWIETHLKFYYQMQAAVGEQITRVLDALRDSDAYENTIVIFSSDHGDMQGAHGGM